MDIKVRYLPEARDFLKSIDENAMKKVLFDVKKVRMGVKDSTSSRNWKAPTYGSFARCTMEIAYRLLSFWDTRSETLIVAPHGFVKKTQKTPKREIARAEAIRKDYFDSN